MHYKFPWTPPRLVRLLNRFDSWHTTHFWLRLFALSTKGVTCYSLFKQPEMQFTVIQTCVFASVNCSWILFTLGANSDTICISVYIVKQFTINIHIQCIWWMIPWWDYTVFVYNPKALNLGLSTQRLIHHR